MDELHYDLVRDAVRVVLLDDGGRILLFQALLKSRSPDPFWEVPGGGTEPGETYAETAMREIYEETGLILSREQISEPRWRRDATWLGRGVRRLQHEVVVQARVPGDRPAITAVGQTAEELDEYIDVRWWQPAEIVASTERFYPGRLPGLLTGFLAGETIDEPFERWN